MSRSSLTVALLLLTSLVLLDAPSFAEDWRGFRGNDGSGISREEVPTPIRWSGSENLRWSIELPGAGSSSPIVVGENVLVTCYSGYGNPMGGTTEKSGLKRHLVCVDRQTGKVQWQSIPRTGR